MMMLDKIVLDDLVNEARACGCDYSLMSFVEAKSRSLDVREGALDVVQQSVECRLGMTFYMNGKYGMYYTNRLERDDLFDFLHKGIEATSLLAGDPDRVPPPAELLFSGNEAEILQVYDEPSSAVLLEELRPRLLHLEELLQVSSQKIISSSVGYSEELFTSHRIDSFGKATMRAKSYYSMGGSLTLQRADEHSRIESYWSDLSFAGGALDDVALAKRICTNANDKLQQVVLPSGSYTVIVESHLVSNLLSPLIKAMSASMIYQRSSFLQNSMDKKIISELITINDNPLQKGRYGAACYDEFGVASYARPLITEGVLRSYFVDSYYGHKLGLPTTPASPILLEFKSGDNVSHQMVEQLAMGVLITGFNGGNCNPVSGDFSFGIEGQIIRGGEKAGFFSGLNLTGNILELWQQVAELSSDVYESSSWKCPTVMFHSVRIVND